ncbi:MAG: GTPase family protein, partial [Waterburya sp.]
MSKFSWLNDWKNRAAKNLDDATKGLTKVLPVDQVAQKIVSLFNVSDDQVAEILTSVRAKLPTTEAILIGKPQAGKSSIVRGLTGVSAEIIGQGFRPHTQNTERYAYPSEDLPLLIFTDTVGLGDIDRNTEDIIQELEAELKQQTQRARILILTVKIGDFATDTLKQIAKQLRQDYPHIPCLLVVTCLHEVYPDKVLDHPEYPPNYEAVARSFQAIQQDFKELGDAYEKGSYRSVLIDFTLEEDGFNPTFYGLEALTEALADLLPEAESRTIYQLLDKSLNDELGNLYRDTARRYLLAFSTMAATLAAVPLPFATMPVLTTLQISLVGLLGKL